MEAIYDVDYFIAKFSAIPERKWTVGKYIRGVKVLGVDFQKKCAQGHCSSLEKNFRVPISEIAHNPKYEEWKSLVKLFGGITTDQFFSNVQIAEINNGENKKYQQPTPKQRVLAALYDLKRMQKQSTTYPDITKSLAVLPIEETTDVNPITHISIIR